MKRVKAEEFLATKFGSTSHGKKLRVTGNPKALSATVLAYFKKKAN